MDGYSRERMMAAHQGETAAYHQGSPTQAPTGSSAPQPPQTHQSPNGPLPHAQQHPHPHPHHPPNPNPHATELPPISTALYSRDRNTYYDPTQDNGPASASASVGRDAAPHPSRYPPQVRTYLYRSTAHHCVHPSRPVTAPAPSAVGYRRCLSAVVYQASSASCCVSQQS